MVQLVMTAGFKPPLAYQDSGLFAPSAPKWAAGFRDPHLMALIPRPDVAAARNGVGFDTDELRVRHTGWCMGKDASDE